MKTFKEFVEKDINESLLQKFNNWVKNTTVIKLERESKIRDKYKTKLKVYPTKIEKLKEKNGWQYYAVTSKKETYLCFLSSSDDNLVSKFKRKMKTLEEGEFWLELGKIDDMVQDGVTPYYIAELYTEE